MAAFPAENNESASAPVRPTGETLSFFTRSTHGARAAWFAEPWTTLQFFASTMSPPPSHWRIGHIWIVWLSASTRPYCFFDGTVSFFASAWNSAIVLGGAEIPAAA